MKKIEKWAALGMAVVAASVILPAVADGDEPEATGTATLADNILTLSGLVTLDQRAYLCEGWPGYAVHFERSARCRRRDDALDREGWRIENPSYRQLLRQPQWHDDEPHA